MTTDSELGRREAEARNFDLRNTVDGAGRNRAWYWNDLPALFEPCECNRRGNTRYFDGQDAAWAAVGQLILAWRKACGFDAVAEENRKLREMLTLVLAIPTMTNEQLAELLANCYIAFPDLAPKGA